jgi:membrane-bound lytic murein transglycosylase B
MNLANVPLAAKLGVGAIAGLALLGAGAAAGVHLGGTVQASQTSPSQPPAVASPSPAKPQANGAAQAARRAALAAEAQVLGIKAKELDADFKAGKTVQQLAAAKGLSQDQFRAQFEAALRRLLDQEVTAGTLTQAQEQQAITRLSASIPNWSQVAQPKKPSPSPSPSPSA